MTQQKDSMSITTNNKSVPDYLLAGDSDEFSLLLQQSFPRKQKSKYPALEKKALLSILENYSSGTLINHLKTQLKEKLSPSDKDFATLHFVDQLFNLYRSSGQLHNDISNLVDRFRPLIASSLIQQNGLILDSKHSVQQSINAVQTYTLGWQPEKSRAAEQYLKTLEKLIINITTAKNAGALLKAKKSIEQFFIKDLKRIEKIEQRLCDTEMGRMRSRFASETSTLELNKRMQGYKLPECVIQFLHSAWRDSLQLVLITQSKESDQWKKMLNLTERLIASFQIHNEDDVLIAVIPEITRELKTCTLSLAHDQHSLELQLSVIASEHFKILQGDTVEYSEFRLIDEHNPLTSAKAKISQSLINAVEEIEQGKWFLLHKVNSQPIRIRLAMKSNDMSRLLFINQLGIKVEEFSFEEFAYKLSSRVVRPLNPLINFDKFTHAFIGKLFSLEQEKNKLKAQAKEENKKAILRENEQKIDARIKALAEASALKEAEMEIKEIENQTNASQLNVGSWIELDNADGEAIRCRLAAKIQVTNKYIFVNRAGMKQAEMQYEDLVNHLNNGTAKIIQLEKYNTTNPLAVIADSLRK